MEQYIIDAFTDKIFAGNSAAVCVMEQWIDESIMQNIAIENNLSETAFAVKEGEHYHLRWFTPGGEIELCGHATLATAYVITRFIEPTCSRVCFDTRSGRLTVEKHEHLLTMDFPAFALTQKPITQDIVQALGVTPQAVYLGADLVCVLKDEQQVRQVKPDLERICWMDGVCWHITAQGTKYDCVTRSFAPKCGIAEDPVCGRGHCHVIPLWAKQLNRVQLTAYQASARGGVLYCQMDGERVKISGTAALYAKSELFLPER